MLQALQNRVVLAINVVWPRVHHTLCSIFGERLCYARASHTVFHIFTSQLYYARAPPTLIHLYYTALLHTFTSQQIKRSKFDLGASCASLSLNPKTLNPKP